MIVVDASVALEALVTSGPSRTLLAAERLHAPHLVDSEVVGGLRRLALAGLLDDRSAGQALRAWERIAVRRHAGLPLIGRVWELRHQVSAYDAAYAALAERLGCALVTVDLRLGRAHGLRCPVTVLPR